jgi:hypothetical protein
VVSPFSGVLGGSLFFLFVSIGGVGLGEAFLMALLMGWPYVSIFFDKNSMFRLLVFLGFEEPDCVYYIKVLKIKCQ